MRRNAMRLLYPTALICPRDPRDRRRLTGAYTALVCDSGLVLALCRSGGGMDFRYVVNLDQLWSTHVENRNRFGRAGDPNPASAQNQVPGLEPNAGDYCMYGGQFYSLGASICIGREAAIKCVRYSSVVNELRDLNPSVDDQTRHTQNSRPLCAKTSLQMALLGSNPCLLVQAAGLMAGIHTLTGAVDVNDPYATPIPDPRLATDAQLVLAASLLAASTTISTTVAPSNLDVCLGLRGDGERPPDRERAHPV